MKLVTIRLALHMWCLTSPPPRMIIPVLLANTAWPFILRISRKKIHTHEASNRWGSCRDPFLLDTLKAAFTFHNVQNQARLFKRVEVENVTQRAVRQCRTEHRNVILKQKITKTYLLTVKTLYWHNNRS